MKLILLLACLLLVGCEQPHKWVNQKLRQELFEKCLKNLPAGPNTTEYNDWDDVVFWCDNIASGQASMRHDCGKDCYQEY